MDTKESKTLLYYNGISKGYKDLYHKEQIKKINLIKSYFPKNQTILDLGSGDGVLNNFFDKSNKIISLDLSFKLLQLNNNKNKINASILNLPIKNNSISFLISLSVFQDLLDIKQGFNELNRILKSKSIVILSFIKITSKKNEIETGIEKYFKTIKIIEEDKDLIYILEKK